MAEVVPYHQSLPAEPELNYEQLWGKLRAHLVELAKMSATRAVAQVVLGHMDFLEDREPFGAPKERSQSPILGTITGRETCIGSR